MLCEKCKQREAAVHKQAIINGVAHSEHLCAECAAKESGNWNPFESFFQNDFFSQPFSSFFEPFFQFGGQTAPQTKQSGISPCPHCGMTWEAFQQNGLLGCSECYDHFKDVLPPLLRSLHGHTEHIGKKPAADASAQQGAATTIDVEPAAESELERLKSAMKQAVETENFEEAARLRDAIKALEAKEKNDGNPA